jgi:hypothetical protein
MLSGYFPRFAALAIAALLSVGQAIAAEGGRFALHFRSGAAASTDALAAWPIGSNSSEGKLKRHDLFAADNPVRLIRDGQAKVELRAPLVMMANGDIVSGLPRRLTPADGRQDQPQRVLLQLESPLMPVDGTGVNVRTDRVQRIIGQEGRQFRPAPEPGTVVLLDGRQLKGSSIRWQEYGLSILTDEGIVEAAFAELADVVFPQVDTLVAALEDSLHAGSMTGPSIMRLAISSGAILTSSRVSREVERSRGRGNSTVEVMYYVQPAWSSHPIAIGEGEIAWIGYRRASEVPLSMLPATTENNARLVGQPRDWLRNRSQASQLVATNHAEADLGLATHATSTLVFTLPPGAGTFSTTVGLDRTAGSGGCVRCRIAAWNAETRELGAMLWDSGVLQGTDDAKSTGKLEVKSLQHLALITDNAHDDRPAGADPLDIRDDVCWLAPLIEMDPEHLKLPQTVAHALPGMASWQQPTGDWSGAKLGNRWNEIADRWEPVLTVPADARLVLKRRATISPLNDVMELVTAVSPNPTEQQFLLKVNGEPVDWRTSEDREAMAVRHEKYVRPWLRRSGRIRDSRDDILSDTLAYWWDLKAYRGREIELELTISGNGREIQLPWQNLSLRSAIANLPASGELPAIDVPLTSAEVGDGETPGIRPLLKDMIPYPGKGVAAIRFLGQVHSGGYGMLRNSTITIMLKPEYQKFVAVVGSCRHTSGAVRVLVDGKPLWERAKMSALQPAEWIEVDIPAGSKQLMLINGNEGLYESSIAWTHAGFVTGN